jgi:hypothetical protein
VVTALSLPFLLYVFTPFQLSECELRIVAWPMETKRNSPP